MKKKLLIAASVLLAGIVYVGAFTSTTVLNPGASTLLISNSCRVTQVFVTATTATNTVAALVDSPTNGLLYVVSGFTNTITYGTNAIVIYTNFFGILTTNIYTNTIVDAPFTNAPATNTYPTRIVLGASGGTTAKGDNVNYYFLNGLMVTNQATGFGPQSVTVTWFNN